MSMKYGRMAFLLMGSIFAQSLFGQGQGNDLPNRVGELEEQVGDHAELIDGIEVDIAELVSDLKDLETAIFAHRRSLSWASVSGASFIATEEGSGLRYLADAAAYATVEGDTFTVGTFQLPHNAEIQGMTCVVRDQANGPYIDITLSRVPLDSTSDPVDNIVSVGTDPAFADPFFKEVTGMADVSVDLVDNSQYAYRLRADFTALGSTITMGGNPVLALRGCRVELAPL